MLGLGGKGKGHQHSNDEVEGSFSAEDVEFGEASEPESPFDEVPVDAAEI